MEFEAKFLRQAMSRGRVWVDENLIALAEELRKLNFRVDLVPNGTPDIKIKEMVADQRFVTNNSKDFEDDIAAYEYCLISTEGVSKDPTTLARIISDAWRTLELRHKHTCKVSLRPDGRHEISYPKELEV